MKWNLEKRDISEIYLNEYNPRTLSKKQEKELKRSLRKFGLCQPIIINTIGKILGGHQRVKLLQSMGYNSIDVYVPQEPLTEKEEEELSIRLNKNTGSWNFDLLADCWDCEDLISYGFSMEELEIESIPDQKNPPTKFMINIKCNNQDQLENIERLISEYINLEGATYKVKIR